MAEPSAVIDPADPRRIAAAADPYLDPTRIQVAVSRDGGRTWGRGRFAVAWTESHDGRRTRSMVALAGSGARRQVLAGPPAAGTPMLPTVAFGPGAVPLILQADLAGIVLAGRRRGRRGATHDRG